MDNYIRPEFNHFRWPDRRYKKRKAHCQENLASGGTVDGEDSRAGVSAWLELTFQPTIVSVKEIYIMERDKRTKSTPTSTLPIVHTPNPISIN